ncbi:Uu.00g011580.m01.CDS01 [Anthostomella pinea]|uniref:adenine phosphoribosyltransferase n=1 Tax=Anthostomella pinea TaxID=933095 RepID=A0AAI8YQ13_9PEZI|nr:Uu.00g011580.m01.CDS01 [Anthostomella pinea]
MCIAEDPGYESVCHNGRSPPYLMRAAQTLSSAEGDDDTAGSHLALRNMKRCSQPQPQSDAQYSDGFDILVGLKLIILVTGESGAGKDYCADIWVSVFTSGTDEGFRTRAVSISKAVKHKYAAATGADVKRLLSDRAYKEQHRSALTTSFYNQRRGASYALSHLVPGSRLLEVRIEANRETRRLRRGSHGEGEDTEKNSEESRNSTGLDYRPNFTFANYTPGHEAATTFAEQYLLPFLHEDLQRLAAMHPGGLALCTSLLQTHFVSDWAKVDAVACCEAGGFIYAAALAARVDIPLALIRKRGKLPPPMISVTRSLSHILSPSTACGAHDSCEESIEMARDVVPKGATVVIVDDVLATGETLCAVLQLLGKAGVRAGDVSVLAVVEFPAYRGWELLHRRGVGWFQKRMTR